MNANQQPKSANFNFLAKHYPDLERIGAICEHYFTAGPIVALITLRRFGELLAQMAAARSVFSRTRGSNRPISYGVSALRRTIRLVCSTSSTKFVWTVMLPHMYLLACIRQRARSASRAIGRASRPASGLGNAGSGA